MTEEWRPVPGDETRYHVSSLGRVRSLGASQPKGGWRAGRIRKLRVDRDGYPRVNFSPKDTRRVADLVLAAFIGPKPEGQVARHRNRIRDDCRLDNLLYGTPDDNRLDAVEHGTFSNISAAQALEIRERALAGERMPQLAAEFGIHYQSVYRIKRGHRWGVFLERNWGQLLGGSG
jgi:hypothetical protein